MWSKFQKYSCTCHVTLVIILILSVCVRFDQTDWADQKQITTDRPRLDRDYSNRDVFLISTRSFSEGNRSRPCSSTLGQVERFSWTDPLSLFHLFHVDLKTPLFLFYLFHVDLETRFYLFHLFHMCHLVPTCAIWLYHWNLCQLSFLRFFFGFLNVIPFLEKLFRLKIFFSTSHCRM